MHQRHQALHCFEIDQIHDLRVASRRLRAVIEQLVPFVPRDLVVRIRRPIRRLTRELGQLRNLDEALLYFTKANMPELDVLLESLAHERKQEHAKALKQLTALNCDQIEKNMNRATKAIMTPHNIASLGLLAILSEQNLTLYRPLFDLQPLVPATGMIEERHEFRIAIKKWRYFTELVRDIMESNNLTDLLTLLRTYQSLLGDMNDRAVYASILTDTQAVPEDLKKRLLSRISREQRGLLKKFRSLLDTQPLTYQFVV